MKEDRIFLMHKIKLYIILPQNLRSQ